MVVVNVVTETGVELDYVIDVTDAYCLGSYDFLSALEGENVAGWEFDGIAIIPDGAGVCADDDVVNVEDLDSHGSSPVEVARKSWDLASGHDYSVTLIHDSAGEVIACM